MTAALTILDIDAFLAKQHSACLQLLALWLDSMLTTDDILAMSADDFGEVGDSQFDDIVHEKKVLIEFRLSVIDEVIDKNVRLSGNAAKIWSAVVDSLSSFEARKSIAEELERTRSLAQLTKAEEIPFVLVDVIWREVKRNLSQHLWVLSDQLTTVIFDRAGHGATMMLNAYGVLRHRGRSSGLQRRMVYDRRRQRSLADTGEAAMASVVRHFFCPCRWCCTIDTQAKYARASGDPLVSEAGVLDLLGRTEGWTDPYYSQATYPEYIYGVGGSGSAGTAEQVATEARASARRWWGTVLRRPCLQHDQGECVLCAVQNRHAGYGFFSGSMPVHKRHKLALTLDYQRRVYSNKRTMEIFGAEWAAQGTSWLREWHNRTVGVKPGPSCATDAELHFVTRRQNPRRQERLPPSRREKQAVLIGMYAVDTRSWQTSVGHRRR